MTATERDLTEAKALLKEAVPALQYAATDPDTYLHYGSIYRKICAFLGIEPKDD